MFVKHIWGFSLFRCFLLLSLFSTAVFGEPSVGPQDKNLFACRVVQQYGASSNGKETIGSLIELNMRQWKPQSNRGIEIFGWNAEQVNGSVYKVTFGYKEMGLEDKILSWQVDLDNSEILPLTPLSARILEMALIF